MNESPQGRRKKILLLNSGKLNLQLYPLLEKEKWGRGPEPLEPPPPPPSGRALLVITGLLDETTVAVRTPFKHLNET